MNISLFKHWIPSLERQDKNHKIYRSKYCPICNESSSKFIFRVNVKLKVFKCFYCGSSGKEFNMLLHRLKYGKNTYVDRFWLSGCYSKSEINQIYDEYIASNKIDSYVKIQTETESNLPF
ncbi:hypothetical protein GCM10011397_10870 [Wenyingzhuangia marina]|nr:hypothetical protein GCM10011397_10870 [Wenyingzhuangia marina]